MGISLKRLESNALRELSLILRKDAKDRSFSSISITEVRITNDLSFAKLYFTSLEDDKKKITDALNKASGFIRSSLCEKIEIRKMPEIHFVYDESVEYGKKIDDIIERINNEKQNLGNN